MLNGSKFRTSAGVGMRWNHIIWELPPQTELKEYLLRL